MPPSLVVDLGRIELPTQQCECRVMPLYYRPKYFHFSNFRIGSHFHKGRTRASVSGCECRVMPLYYRPKYFHFSNFRIGSHFHKGRTRASVSGCECRVMPLYYRPKYFHFSNFRIGSHFHKGRTRASVSGCVNGIELPCSCQSQYQPTYLLYHGKQGKSSDEGISTKKVPRSTASWGNNTVIGPEWDFTRTVHR